MTDATKLAEIAVEAPRLARQLRHLQWWMDAAERRFVELKKAGLANTRGCSALALDAAAERFGVPREVLEGLLNVD